MRRSHYIQIPYFIYIQWENSQEKEGCFVTYWYQEDDLQEAIFISAKDAESELFLTSIYVESVLFDEDADPPEQTIRTGYPALRCFDEIHTWPLSSEDRGFIFPCGIVPANIEGAFELKDIREGYFEEHSENLFSITVIIDGRNFYERIKNIFEILPSKDGLEINIKSHWNNRNKTEVWLAGPNYKDARILDFIIDNRTHLLDNGGIELAIYSRKEKTTLRITDHKLIRYYADDEKYINLFNSGVQRLGLSNLEKKRIISDDYHHYHYTPKDCFSPEKLKSMLESLGFKRVDEQNDREYG